jgi:hypothetical protein
MLIPSFILLPFGALCQLASAAEPGAGKSRWGDHSKLTEITETTEITSLN